MIVDTTTLVAVLHADRPTSRSSCRCDSLSHKRDEAAACAQCLYRVTQDLQDGQAIPVAVRTSPSIAEGLKSVRFPPLA